MSRDRRASAPTSLSAQGCAFTTALLRRCAFDLVNHVESTYCEHFRFISKQCLSLAYARPQLVSLVASFFRNVLSVYDSIDDTGVPFLAPKPISSAA